jgi:Domain of unknown function (DUF4114)/PEP-CTERM motif
MNNSIAKILAGTAAASALLLSSAPAFAFDPAVFKQFVNTERNALDPSIQPLDLSKLTLQYDHEVQVYFIGEGARNRNQLGVTATGTTQIDDTILFDDIVCLTDACATQKEYKRPDLQSTTTLNGGLEAGDSVSLGMIEAGTTLDFWLNKDGFIRDANGKAHTRLTADASQNADGKQHLMAYNYENYLVLAWEDLLEGDAGYDFDYNDVVFVVDIGEGNIPTPPAQTPEPSTAAALIGLSALGMSRLRRKRNA